MAKNVKVTIVSAYNHQFEMTRTFLTNLQSYRMSNKEIHISWTLILVNGGDFERIEHDAISKRIDIKDTAFSKVINAGLREVPECDYVFYLGNDSFPNKDGWLGDLIELQMKTGAWITCPMQDRPGLIALQHLHKEEFEDYYEVYMYPSIAYLIPYVVFKKLGYWDEGYIRTGMYGDNDYCNRVHQEEGKIILSKNILLNHLLSKECSIFNTVNEDMVLNGEYYRKKWGLNAP